MLFLNNIRLYVRRLKLEYVCCLVIVQFMANSASAQVLTLGLETTTSMVNHHDPLEIDKSLTLSKVVDLTMDTHPDIALITSMEEEAAAISERSKSWTAGASQLAVGYQSIASFRLNYGTANLMVPLWNLGQRDAQENLAKEAEKYVNQNKYQTLKEARIAYKQLGGHVITDDKTNAAVLPLNEAINKLTLLNQYLNDIISINSKAPIAEENRKIYNDFIKANNPNFKTEIKTKPTFKKQLNALKDII